MGPTVTNYDLEAGLQEVANQGGEWAGEDTVGGWEAEVQEEGEIKVSSERKQSKRNCARSQRRRDKRMLQAEKQGLQVKQAALKHRKAMVGAQAFTSTDTQAGDLKAAEGGWLGSQKKTKSEHENDDVQHLLGRGFQLVRWDGKKPHAILDKSGRVVAILAGMPGGSFEREVVATATLAFREESEALLPPNGGNARGSFHAVLAGFSHGGGTERPTQTLTAKIYTRAIRTLTRNPAVRRLAGYQNQAFKTYFPDTYAYYQSTMSQFKKEPLLKFPFVGTFPSAAFNLGPQTVCVPHRDSKNLAFGICCISALGNFDPTRGGHLVLEELGLVIEFPPGSTALIPSAVVTHWNTRVQTGEKRYSFTQYASGSLFAYVENKMRTDKTILREGDEEEKKMWKAFRLTRWKEGLSMFPLFSSYC